ncbi:MAG: hypothetical protein EPO11_09475 [Gammaproteobacteria bacterium]|nr:MAG: hypothetical protein EPO11_09475 [Gammaproteobacteria bacterium]
MSKLIELFLQDKPDKDKLLKEIQEIFSEAKNICDQKTQKGDSVSADDLLPAVEAILNKELTGTSFSIDSSKKISTSARDWNLLLETEHLEGEERSKAASQNYQVTVVQSIVFFIFSNLIQEEIRSSLIKLLKGLENGQMILQNKINQLSLINSDESKNKIALLKNAIGHNNDDKSRSIANYPANTFAGLSSYITETLRSAKVKNISLETLQEINTNFNQLINDKIIQPLQKYNNEKNFLSKFKEWASDTMKKIFGFKTLSTKGTLLNVVKTENKFFTLWKRKVENIFPTEEIFSKKQKM